jgi:hypothetical protein
VILAAAQLATAIVTAIVAAESDPERRVLRVALRRVAVERRLRLARGSRRRARLVALRDALREREQVLRRHAHHTSPTGG